MFYVYILRCSDNSFYTGYTKNIDNRLDQHNKGVGSRYTRARLPVKLGYHEEIRDRSSAMCREREIKKLSRKQKEELVGV